MPLELWFPEDVKAKLAAIATTHNQQRTACPARNGDFADGYNQGFFDALNAVAVAFGVMIPQDERRLPTTPERR